MITSISKKLLVAALSLAMAGGYLSSLDAMKRLREDSGVQDSELQEPPAKKQKTEHSEKSFTQSQNIILRIYPHTQNIYCGETQNKGPSYHSFLEGFNNNQYERRPTRANALLGLPGYPLSDHKKLGYLTGNENLTILSFDPENNCEYIEVKLDNGIKERFLKYLCHDSLNKNRDCGDFVSNVVFDKAQNPVNAVADLLSKISDIPLMPHLYLDTKKCNKAGLSGGQVISLVNPQGSLIHFALYLGHDLFLSKYGQGCPFVISSLDHMNQFYCCNDFVFISKIYSRSDVLHLDPLLTDINSVRKIAFALIVCIKWLGNEQKGI